LVQCQRKDGIGFGLSELCLDKPWFSTDILRLAEGLARKQKIWEG